MADEVQVRFNGKVVNGDMEVTLPNISTKFDQTTAFHDSGVLAIGTSEEVVSFNSDITSEGFLLMRNLDATNFVDYGPESGGALVSFGRMKATEWGWMRLVPAITVRMQANTAPVNVQYWLFDD